MIKDISYKKNLVFGIIVLFILGSVTPTISGNIGKTINKTTIQVPNNIPLSDDYMNAYWKFDEGSGNIAHDSSGHDYDGTIYGATWTTGYSSYALDFDGINDYVDLDAYAQNYLGFNKTDDIIFELYFNSISTNTGMIYSNCWIYGENPGIHIALNSNGTLEFRAWRLSCGITLNSVNSYNDGNWHHVKIFYNGISSDPTVDMYVDDVLDINITEWVCYFYADQFNYAKIGRLGNNSLNFFDGKIDEFKITKYPGGNEQNPPNISGPTDGFPGVTYNYTFVTQDPEEDDIWLEINWGDGNVEKSGPHESGQAVVKSHKWNKDGKYNITARSIDIWHFSRWSDPYVVKIGNQPPDPPIIDGPTYGEPGVQYSYTFASQDREGNNVYYYVDWGDDTYNDWFGPYPSGEEATAAHIWDSIDNYNIKAKAKDNLDNEGDWSDFYPVRIGNEAPEKPTISGPPTGKPGIEYEYTFVSTDSQGDDICYEINWGDGKEEVTDYYKSGETVSRNHTWDKRGTYIIRARAGDILFGEYSEWATFTVIIPKNKQTSRSIISQKFVNILLFTILERYYQRFVR